MMEVGQQRSQLEVVSRRMEESQGRHREQQEARGEAERSSSQDGRRFNLEIWNPHFGNWGMFTKVFAGYY